ncbi:helicase associated domain-containing protein [Streptomyces sp. NPDC020917]|uniref:helicase associated domain-containing protein n=1 Tax=Streptomyces sp. NPDC020917 TaxID=3365102 RepID=UPI0037B8A46C
MRGRKSGRSEARREAGQPAGSTTGALTEERRDALEAIDPSWCPAWRPVARQRCYRLRRTLITTRAPYPPSQARPPSKAKTSAHGAKPNDSTGANRSPRRPGCSITCSTSPRRHPTNAHRRPAHRPTNGPPTSAAARQFHTREGHLQVPRKHVEEVDGVPYKLGMFIDNARRRADKLSEERHQELTALGMRW